MNPNLSSDGFSIATLNPTAHSRPSKVQIKLRECSFCKLALSASRREPNLLQTWRRLGPTRDPPMVGQPNVDGTVFKRQHQKRMFERLPPAIADCGSVAQDACDAHKQPRAAWVKTQERNRPSEIPGIGGRRQQKHSPRENETRQQRRRLLFR